MEGLVLLLKLNELVVNAWSHQKAEKIYVAYTHLRHATGDILDHKLFWGSEDKASLGSGWLRIGKVK